MLALEANFPAAQYTNAYEAATNYTSLAYPYTPISGKLNSGTIVAPASGIGASVNTDSPASQAIYRTATNSVQTVALTNSDMIATGIAEFVPAGLNASQTPSMSLLAEPVSTGSLPSDWSLYPQFTVVDGNAGASLAVPAGTSLYGGGEFT